MALTPCDQDQNGELFPANWREAGRLVGVTLSETEFAAVDGQSERMVSSAHACQLTYCRKSYMPMEYGKAYGTRYGHKSPYLLGAPAILFLKSIFSCLAVKDYVDLGNRFVVTFRDIGPTTLQVTAVGYTWNNRLYITRYAINDE